MELFTFTSAEAYRKSMLYFYRNDPLFIDNKSGVFNIVCNPKGAFFGNTQQQMLGVCHGEETLCQAVLIKHRDFDALMLAFFEASQDAAVAVQLLLEHALVVGRSLGCTRLIIGMDGHCNYGLGFSCDFPTVPPLFGESRNPNYYHAFFREGYRRIDLSSYWGDFAAMAQEIEITAAKIARRSEAIATECHNMHRFSQEIARYTAIDNRIFSDHWNYFPRSHPENLELFRAMQPLLAPGNLIFAVRHNGNNVEDVGYILTYPDFNELVVTGKAVGINTFIAHKLLGRPISTIKVVEFAVLPEYRSQGVLLKLLVEAIRRVKQTYPSVTRVVSSWIMDENHASKNVTTRFAPHLYSRYAVYEKDL